MKQLTLKSMLAAAVVVLAAGSASAQTLKADIPFTFHAAGVTMPAGTYELRTSSSRTSPYVIIRNTDSHNSVLAMYALANAPNDWRIRDEAMLRFQCNGGYCALSEAWTGAASSVLRFNAPKLGHDGDTRIAEIRMTMSTKAD